jgi:serine protease Do
LWRSACLLVPLTAVLALAAGARAGDRSGDRSGDRPGPGDKKSQMVKLPAAFDKAVPETIDDLKQIQTHVKTVIDKVMPAVVNIKVGAGQGSGVIVTEDGYVLTAGHVSQKPGQTCLITFPDGKEVKGKTLGWNKTIDSGMVKIMDEGKYPFCEMGKSSALKKGEYAIAIGHPGGYKKGRTPPVRLGRVLEFSNTLIRTDCVLVGGDSGGPLFDMQGKVIGINSRINIPINSNIHVPVDTFVETWERLVKSEEWSGNAVQTARLGLQADPDAKEIRITKIDPDSAAAKAGLKIDDIILAIDGKTLKSFDELRGEIEKRKPGQEVVLQVRRGEETMTIRAVLGKS